jgi:HK97 family phage portal protein
MSLIKQLTPAALKFSPATDSGFNWTRVQTLIHGPGASDAENTVKNGDGNSAVFACLMAIAMAYPEPPIRVYRQNEPGKYEEMPESPLQKLIDMPVQGGALTQLEIQFWIAWAKHSDGNAYLIKVRSGNSRTGNVIETWPVSPALMRPVTIKNTRDFISYYELQVGPNDFEKIPTENVIHFRLGIDDLDMRKGLSPIKRLVRQIGTDEEVDKFTLTLLKNYAVPGLVVIPAANTTMDVDKADLIRTQFRRKFSSDNRGDVAVMSTDSRVEQFGFSPEQMNLSSLRDVPEERIAAVIGVPPILAGLGAGLDRATYNNVDALIEYFTEKKLVPLWGMDDAKLQASLKPDFSSDPRVVIRRDLSEVRALQEDMDKKYFRLNTGVQGARPWITVNEARSDVGLPPIDGGDELREPVPEQLQSQRPEDDESGDEENNGRKHTFSTNGRTGDAISNGYPFRPNWKSYP